MAQSKPTSFLNDTAVAARDDEVTAADWATGCNNAASNSPGIGIALGQANAAGTPEQFTLTDQNGAGRTPQDGSHIGVDGLDDGASGPGVVPIKSVTNNANGTGAITDDGDCDLNSLATGWETDAGV